MRIKKTPDPATLSLADAAVVLGISKASAYRMARRYEQTQGAEGIPVIRFGRRIVVPTARLEALLTTGLPVPGPLATNK
jgi:hypothetical protein